MRCACFDLNELAHAVCMLWPGLNNSLEGILASSELLSVTDLSFGRWKISENFGRKSACLAVGIFETQTMNPRAELKYQISDVSLTVHLSQ